MTRLLPPFLFAGLLVPLVLLWSLHPIEVQRPFDLRVPPWDVPLILGAALLIAGRLQFRRNNSEIHTFATPRNLVTSGIFRFTRNPMYLGFALVLFGGALYVNFWCAYLVPLVFIAAANWWYIPAEERNLRAAFGNDYAAYTSRVRRWI